jgi:hypothetical protein
MKAPRLAIVHDVIKESGCVLPHPSVVFDGKTSAGNPWVARTLSPLIIHKRGKVSSNLVTHEATKFVRPHKSHMRQYIIKCLFNRGQSTWALIDIGGGCPLGAPNLQSRSLSTLSIQYFLLFPNCFARSPIVPTSESSS